MFSDLYAARGYDVSEVRQEIIIQIIYYKHDCNRRYYILRQNRITTITITFYIVITSQLFLLQMKHWNIIQKYRINSRILLNKKELLLYIGEKYEIVTE